MMKDKRFYGVLAIVLALIGLFVLTQEGQTPAVSHGGSVKDYVSLVYNLRAAGAVVEPASEVSQPFFSVKGQVITVNGSRVQVFEYADATAAEAEAALVSQDGSSIGTTMVTWVAPPHFYQKGKLIVLYVGNDGAVLNVLKTVLGSQFAGRSGTIGITNFEQCAKAGYPILESYPRQCKTPDGRTFVEESLINADLDTQFQLKINQIATIKSENLEIKLLNIIDSRCPSAVVCVWAGEATVIVDILNFGDFSLTSTAANEDLAVKNFDGYSIKLVKVDPYPKTTKKIGVLDYTATLVVSKI